MLFQNLREQWWPSEPPALTEKNLPAQNGKVFIVTGGNSGVGFELINAMYPSGATIYMACRSKERGEQAIQQLKDNWPSATNPATVRVLQLDLNDLASIKATAEEFRKQESKLHVLWNNAGIAGDPVGTVTKQNLECHIGVNCVGPFLLTQYLLPVLKRTAQTAPIGSVRVIWASSYTFQLVSPKGGLNFDELEHGGKYPVNNYSNSKEGNWLMAVEMARRHGKNSDNILSLCLNPGNLATPVWKHQPGWFMMVVNFVLYEAKYGGYTELFAGLSEELTIEDGGEFIIPWGRKHQMTRTDILAAMDENTLGRENSATRFWEWCQAKVKDYV